MACDVNGCYCCFDDNKFADGCCNEKCVYVFEFPSVFVCLCLWKRVSVGALLCRCLCGCLALQVQYFVSLSIPLMSSLPLVSLSF